MTEPRNTCPTPQKLRYATVPAAEDDARRAGFSLNKQLYPYENCPCGWVHLTSSPPDAAKQTRPPVLMNGPLDDVDFMMLVRSEVMGRAAPEDAEILRTPGFLLRWSDALKNFQIDISMQLQAKSGVRDPGVVEWRKRLSKVQRALSIRRAEVKRLLQQKQFSVPRVVDPARLDLKEKKRLAGEMAVKRLKDAHSWEFTGYLAEEYAKIGLPVPKQWTPEHLEGKKDDGSDELPPPQGEVLTSE